MSSPFAQFGDSADYSLVGDVEDSGASWSLTGGAGAQAGNETYMVGGAGTQSLRLPAQSSATTKRVCIGTEHPAFRFFVKHTAGSDAGRLRVEVVVYGADGSRQVLEAGTIDGSDDWAPSSALPTRANEVAAQQGSAVEAAFRFTPQGGGLWAIDDVYVDPFKVI